MESGGSMKAPPQSLRPHAFDLLCQDILDRKSKGFDRLEALSHTVKELGNG
jgi:hypothetical protein